MTSPHLAMAPVTAVGASEALTAPPPALAPNRADAFAHLLMDGVQSVDRAVAKGDAAAARFAVDDSVPVHEVTYALEHARLSLELLMQVRARVVEAVQDFTRMQL